VGDVTDGRQGLGDSGVIIDVQVDDDGVGVIVIGGGHCGCVPEWQRAVGERAGAS
jgi:hypothetical protein